MITPDEFNLFNEEKKQQILRKEYIDQRRRAMEKIAKRADSGSSDEHCEVYRGKDLSPIASFRQSTFANVLASYLEPKGSVRYKDTTTQTDIDKYLEPIKLGKKPFHISLMANGDLFESSPARDCIHDPGIAKNHDYNEITEEILTNERAGIGGTFWGYDEHDAFVEADKFRMQMIKEGKL